MLRRGHRLVERREVAYPQHAVGGQRLQVELDLGEEPQRALGPDQQMGHVVAAAGSEGVDVVAADPSEKGGETARDLVGFAGAERAHAPDQIGVVVITREPGEVAGYLGESDRGSARENRADRVYVVHHVAVADGARTARVVAGHAPDGGPVGRRDVDGEEESPGPEPCIEAVEHDAGLHRDPA